MSQATVVSRPASERTGVDPGVGEHERAGAVGALAHAGGVAGLTEQRGLLVAGDAGDGQRQPQERVGVGGADDAGARHQLRQRRPRDVEQVAQLVGPGALVEVDSSVRLALLGWVTRAAPPVSRAMT